MLFALGFEVDAIIGSTYSGCGFGGGILPDCSSKLRLLVINLAYNSEAGS